MVFAIARDGEQAGIVDFDDSALWTHFGAAVDRD
jgi:hypothetical protein